MCQENRKLIFVLIFCAIQTGVYGQVCRPMVKENDPVIINCTVNVELQSLTWRVDTDIVQCFHNYSCTYNSSLYTIRWSNNSGLQINHLTIHNVHRDKKQILCTVNNIQAQDCTLCVTTNPQKPTCETPKFTGSDNSTLTITCETSSVYPDAMCSVKHFNTSNKFVADASTEKSLLDNVSSDVSVKCIIQLKLNNVSPTDESFAVSFVPVCDLSEGVTNTALSTTSEFTTFISLRLPVVSKLNCNSVYPIPLDSSVTCKCELSELGNPPGSARWYSSTGIEVGQLDDRASLLNVTLDASNLKPEYHCKPYSILNTTQDTSRQVYKPTFAYGPYRVVTESREFDLCIGNEVYITCSVPFDQVQPEPLYTILFNGEELLSKQKGQNNGTSYNYKYIFSPKTTGVIQYRCRAYNSISSQYYIDQFGTLTITGPPTSYPVITVSNLIVINGQIKVKRNTNIEIACSVDGGYPKVSTVTIQCPSQTVTGNGQYAKLTTKVNESLHGLSCMCTATHESISTCYQHSSSKVTFTVTDDDEALPVLAIGLGAAGGLLFILIIIIGIIVVVKLRKLREKQQTIHTIKDDYNSIRPNDPLDNGSIYCEIYDNNEYMIPELAFNPSDDSTMSGKDNYSFNTSPTYQSSDWTEYNKPPLCRTNMNQQHNDYLHVL